MDDKNIPNIQNLIFTLNVNGLNKDLVKITVPIGTNDPKENTARIIQIFVYIPIKKLAKIQNPKSIAETKKLRLTALLRPLIKTKNPKAKEKINAQI